METPQLRNPAILPSGEVLENLMGDCYMVFDKLMKTITDSQYNLLPEWHYYKDGKAWLCKVCYKKKTVFWLSVWEKFFKIVFYFTEKNCVEIADLDIDEKIKEKFSISKNIGRLIPLVIEMKSEEQIKDALKIIEYKKSLK